MIIINADDWGGWASATDAAFDCFNNGRITSVSAMVFMEDSERGAELAKECQVDAGLHLNLNESFTGTTVPAAVREGHARVRRFLRFHRYAQLIYNPWLRSDFQRLYSAQLEEFRRLYGSEPSHVNGHQHMHLCRNMVVQRIIEPGRAVRRNFSFFHGEKSLLNRIYRRYVDGRLADRYQLADYFFSLLRCLDAGSLARVAALGREANVELMAHPEKAREHSWLMSDAFRSWAEGLRLGTYSILANTRGGVHHASPICAAQS